MISNDGSYLQDALFKAIKEYTTFNKGYGHRFPDTKSAGGNFLQAQPGDFFLLVPGGSLLIECKSTKTHASLLSLAWHGTVGKRQIAKHKLWQRAGHPSLYLYGDITEKDELFEWHSGSCVIKKENKPLLVGEIKALGQSLPGLLNLIII
jgi:hypothetical protein